MSISLRSSRMMDSSSARTIRIDTGKQQMVAIEANPDTRRNGPKRSTLAARSGAIHLGESTCDAQQVVPGHQVLPGLQAAQADDVRGCGIGTSHLGGRW